MPDLVRAAIIRWPNSVTWSASGIPRQVVVGMDVDVPQSGHQLGAPEVDRGGAICRGRASVGTDLAKHVDSRSGPLHLPPLRAGRSL